jgi:hypothetical protein
MRLLTVTESWELKGMLSQMLPNQTERTPELRPPPSDLAPDHARNAGPHYGARPTLELCVAP